jgi:hypothetical protein
MIKEEQIKPHHWDRRRGVAGWSATTISGRAIEFVPL